MRLDKLLSQMGKATRSQSGQLIRAGKILVNGVPAKKSDMQVNPETDTVLLNGVPVIYKEFTYIMLNKPQGFVSATDDPWERTVLELVSDEDKRKGLFPCGRLDKNTLGLIILTNDGATAHRLLSPKHHVEKSYIFKVASLLSNEDVQLLQSGVDIGGYYTKPCKIQLFDDMLSGEIILTEGKYHQIKRMMEAIDNKIVYLERIRFGGISLDTSLARGEWRYLTDDEEKIFLKGE
ncbi:MAG: rRNA pseudouridine synthase [Clostridia bacterium]|nr:rRNA pseudouridine synthase [Clostridia bacterium]